MMIPLNPYVAGNPVGDSPAFVGRADVLREVLRILRRPQDNAIVLYGQRRIGKTSILQHLAARLPDEGPYRPVYFDLQDKADWPLDRVLRELARTIADALRQSDPDLDNNPETTFRDEWLPDTLDDLPDDCSLVLLFDEFDVLAAPQKEQAAAAFFPYLRGLLASDPERLQFVFVIGRNVDDLDTIALSLFKGTPYQRVSLLSREDTVDLVCLSEVNNTLRWPDEAVERVWQLTNGHPFLTQQLCSHVWEQVHDEEPGEPPTVPPADVDEAVPDALDASRNTLEWQWDGLPPAERVVASALAVAGPGPITQEGLEHLLYESGVRVLIRELQNAPQLLQDWDLIEPSGEGYSFRVELLRRWLTQYKPLSRVKEELDRILPVAENFYQAGRGLFTSGDLEQAVDPLRQAIRINPNHLKAHLLLGQIYLELGDLPGAEKVLREAHVYDPVAARPLLVQMLLAEVDQVKSVDEQLEICDQILNLQPDQPKASELRRNLLIQIGDRALEQRDFVVAFNSYVEAQAVKEIEQAVQKIEGQSEYFDTSIWEAVQRALQTVLQMQTADSKKWNTTLEVVKRQLAYAKTYELGKRSLEQNQLESAIQTFHRLVSWSPKYRDTALQLAAAVQRWKSQSDIISIVEKQAQRIQTLQREIEKQNTQIERLQETEEEVERIRSLLFSYRRELRLHRKEESFFSILLRGLLKLNPPMSDPEELMHLRLEPISWGTGGSPLAEFVTTYVLGDDHYDPSFSIELESGEFLGECGVGISETISIGKPEKVTAFEVWLFDKNDIHTVTMVLMSQYAFDDEALRTKLAPKGGPVLAKVGKELILETESLRVQARVIEVTYGIGNLPPNSFFEHLTMHMAAWVKPEWEGEQSIDDPFRDAGRVLDSLAEDRRSFDGDVGRILDSLARDRR